MINLEITYTDLMYCFVLCQQLEKLAQEAETASGFTLADLDEQRAVIEADLTERFVVLITNAAIKLLEKSQ